MIVRCRIQRSLRIAWKSGENLGFAGSLIGLAPEFNIERLGLSTWWRLQGRKFSPVGGKAGAPDFTPIIPAVPGLSRSRERYGLAASDIIGADLS